MLYQDKVTIQKLLYSLFVVIVCLVLAHIPVWGVKPTLISALFVAGSPLRFTDMLSGGSLSQLTVGGFGVTSLITSSIVLQLAGIVFPKLEKIHADGEYGRRLYDRVTLILAVLGTLIAGIVLTVFQASYYDVKGFMVVIPILEWTLGTAIIALLAQSIHDRGIGEGMTLVLAANIASRIPSELVGRVIVGQSAKTFAILFAVLFVVTVLAVLLQAASIRVRIQQTRKSLSIMNAEGEIPIPLAASSVLPIVYASAVVSLPSIISAVTGIKIGFLGTLLKFVDQTGWYTPTEWEHVAGLLIYVLMVFAFSWYASAMSFSCPDVANAMRERGDVLPGIRPGKDTEDYLDVRRRKLSVICAVFLVLIAVLPDFFLARLGIRGFSFTGTSLIIMMAAFWGLRLRVTGLFKHFNPRYQLWEGR